MPELNDLEHGKFDSLNRVKIVSTDAAKIVQFAIGEHSSITLTYVPSGNGAGEIETVVYHLDLVIVATLTLTYDASNRVVTVTKS